MKNSQLQILAILILSGMIHLFIGISEYSESHKTLDLLILMNGIAFLIFSLFYYFGVIKSRIHSIDANKPIILIIILVFTVVTIASYFAVWGINGLSSPTGMITKVLEAALTYFVAKELQNHE